MFTDFLTLDMLKVFFVAVAVTVLLTEFFKDIVDGLFKVIGIAISKVLGQPYQLHIPTKYVVFGFALAVIFAPLYFDVALTPPVVVAGVLNGILLTLTAMKSYETILDKAVKKYSEEDFNKTKPPDLKIGGSL